MRIVRPFRSFSVARGCARVDSTLDTAKLCSDGRVDADSPRLRAVFGGGKTFLHSLGQTQTSARPHDMSVLPPIADLIRLQAKVRSVPTSDMDGVLHPIPTRANSSELLDRIMLTHASYCGFFIRRDCLK